MAGAVLKTLSVVMRGLDPRIHHVSGKMDCRVKPGNDAGLELATCKPSRSRFAWARKRGHARPPMTVFLHSQADLDAAVAALVAGDPRLAPVLALTGPPALRRREPGFAGLASTICGQQLSIKAAAAIWGRLTAAYDPLHHDHIRRARADRLGRLGLSAAKIKTLKAIAGEIAKGRLDLDALAGLPADEAHARRRAVDRRYLSFVLPRPW